MSDVLLNVEQTAKRLGCATAGALRARYRRTPERLPPAIRVGRRLYWSRDDIEVWIDALKIEERARIERDAEFRRRMAEMGL